MFTSANYLGFFLKLMLAFGIIFELPVVSFVLSKLGLITPSFLISKTKYALVVSFILGALLTPPDIISQIVLALPLMLLYGISILVSFIAQPKKKTTDD
jgi:sec-independent protein translocase protein TatC